MLRFDLHVHTNYSADGLSTVEEILKAAEAAGLDGVAITDHNTTAGARHALEVARSMPGILVIPGEEVTTSAGHLIVLGITQDLTRGMSVEDTIKEAKKLGGIIVVPHPYNLPRHGMPIPAGADAVEVYNSRFVFGYHNRKAKQKARKLALPEVSGSDAHIASLVGSAVTCIESKKDLKDVLAAIKNGKTSIVVKKTPLPIYARQMVNGWIKRLRSVFIHKRK